MRIILGLRYRHFWGSALLLGAVVFCVLLASEPMPALGQTSPSAPSPAGNAGRLPLTTSSPEAARLFEQGLRLSHDIHFEQALGKWREAVKKDPNFVQAWIYILWWTPDPVEEKEAAEKAQLGSRHVTRGEKLLVRWMLSRKQGRFVDAIAAMNDLLAMSPRDAELNYEAAFWLLMQGEYEVSARFAKRTLEIDPNFAAALNIMSYDLAGLHQYDQAVPYLKRYAGVEPSEPNPRDSLAEVLQKAGRLEESLAEYREALKLDPGFYDSQFGLGNDYALLGKQDRAREEYAKAVPMAPAPVFRLWCKTQSAIAFAREGNGKQARVQLEAVLEQATKLQLNDYRSAILQDLALLAESRADAFQHLDEAESVLQGPAAMSEADRIPQLASILRIRARLAAEAGELAIASAAVARLQKMVQDNPSNNAVERAYNGAHGSLLAAQSKIGAAIEALHEDPEDPFSLAKLAELQAASGNSQDAADAAEIRARLKADYGTSLEDWLVVRRFRP